MTFLHFLGKGLDSATDFTSFFPLKKHKFQSSTSSRISTWVLEVGSEDESTNILEAIVETLFIQDIILHYLHMQ